MISAAINDHHASSSTGIYDHNSYVYTYPVSTYTTEETVTEVCEYDAEGKLTKKTITTVRKNPSNQSGGWFGEPLRIIC
jgi:hypothetical protein